MILLKFNLLTLSVWVLFALLALVIAAHFLSEFKQKRFKQDCIYLKEAIDRSKVTEDSYNAIEAQFDELDANSDAELYQRIKLRQRFEKKFADVIQRLEINEKYGMI